MAYVTIAQVRARPGMSDEGKFPDDDIEMAIAWFESKFEGRVGVAFDAREVTVTVDGSGRRDQRLPYWPIRSVSAVTVDNGGDTDTGFTVDEVADLVVTGTGYVRRRSLGSFPRGESNITFEIVHGLDFADFPEIVDACLVEVEDKLKADVTSGRGTRRVFVAGEGTATIFEKGTFETRVANKVVEDSPGPFPLAGGCVMPDVVGTERDPAGNPQANAIVRVSLIASTSPVPAPGYAADHAIEGEWATRTDEDGEWTMTLEANATLSPLNTYYQADVTPRIGRTVRHIFVVPDGAGPYAVGAILAATPADLLLGGIDGGTPTAFGPIVVDGGVA